MRFSAYVIHKCDGYANLITSPELHPNKRFMTKLQIGLTMHTKLIGVVLVLASLAGGCGSAESEKPKFLNAISQNDNETAIALLSKYPELSKATNDAGVPILCLVLSENNPDLVEPLLKAGAGSKRGEINHSVVGSHAYFAPPSRGEITRRLWCKCECRIRGVGCHTSDDGCELW